MRRSLSAAVLVITACAQVGLAGAATVTRNQTYVRPSARTIRSQTISRAMERSSALELKRLNLTSQQYIISPKLNYLAPSSWKIDTSNTAALTQGNLTFHVALFAPFRKDDQFHENINLVTEDLSQYKNMTLKAYTELGLAQEKALFSSFKELDRQDLTIAGYPAQGVHFLATINDLKLEFYQAWFLKNNTAYVWTYAADQNDAPLHSELFQGLLKTVNFYK